MPAPGGADPISVEATVDRDTVEYRPADDTIRYVARWTHTDQDAVERGAAPEREPSYETVPFERWARTECAAVGARRIEETVRSRLGDASRNLPIQSGVAADGSARVIRVSLVTTLARDGTLVAEPPVSEGAVVASTPATVTVTLAVAGRRYTSSVPVTVQRETCRLE